MEKTNKDNEVFVCGTNGKDTLCCSMVGHRRNVINVLLRIEVLFFFSVGLPSFMTKSNHCSLFSSDTIIYYLMKNIVKELSQPDTVVLIQVCSDLQ